MTDNNGYYLIEIVPVNENKNAFNVISYFETKEDAEYVMKAYEHVDRLLSTYKVVANNGKLKDLVLAKDVIDWIEIEEEI